jgi:hypothetical protein
MLPEPIAVTLQVIEALQALRVPYLIGGSLASALHGVARATADADLVADLHTEHAEPLAKMLQPAFYADAQAIRDAILHRSSFNVIHLEAMFKVDIFIPKRRPFDRVQLERRTKQIISAHPKRTAYFASAEDIVLAKLEWYQIGGRVSERQWRDVLGVLKAQNTRLDMAYLRHWASALSVSNLLEQAMDEAGRARS